MVCIVGVCGTLFKGRKWDGNPDASEASPRHVCSHSRHAASVQPPHPTLQEKFDFGKTRAQVVVPCLWWHSCHEVRAQLDDILSNLKNMPSKLRQYEARQQQMGHWAGELFMVCQTISLQVDHN
eukprot:4700989-Amphidinium_carterae.1